MRALKGSAETLLAGAFDAIVNSAVTASYLSCDIDTSIQCSKETLFGNLPGHDLQIVSCVVDRLPYCWRLFTDVSKVKAPHEIGFKPAILRNTELIVLHSCFLSEAWVP